MILLAALLACGGEGRVLVITHSGRPAPAVACGGCDTFDLAAGGRPGRRYRTVVLDAGSTPGDGAADDALVAAVAAADPRGIVAAGGYAAELGLLERLFARAPRLEEVRAAPGKQTRALPTPDAACLASERPDRCFPLPADTQVYDRARVASLVAAADRAVREELWTCRASPRFVHVRPHYLCVDDGRAAALLTVDPARIEPACVADHPSRYMVDTCEVRTR